MGNIWTQFEAEYGKVRTFFAKYPWLVMPAVGLACWVAGRLHLPI